MANIRALVVGNHIPRCHLRVHQHLMDFRCSFSTSIRSAMASHQKGGDEQDPGQTKDSSSDRNRPKEDYGVKMQLQQSRFKDLVSHEIFDQTTQKDRQTFKNAIELFSANNLRKRGAVEFILAALKHMKQFDAHRDLEAYRALINVLPKGPYVPSNLIQADFGHFPKQQDCIVQVLTEMEMNRVFPDEELGILIKNVFGFSSAPYRKYCRMAYWMPKFKNLSPFPLPNEVPRHPLAAAKLAVNRVCSVDPMSEVVVFDLNEEFSENVDGDQQQQEQPDRWVVSGQSPEQRRMVKELPKDRPVYVEGGFRIWLRDSQVTYFILRAEPVPRDRSGGVDDSLDPDDVSDLKLWMRGQGSSGDQDRSELPEANVHEQEDGSILAVAATSSSCKSSLLAWIRLLQRQNPDLQDIPVLFTLQSHSPLPLVPLGGGPDGQNPGGGGPSGYGGGTLQVIKTSS